MKQTAKIALAHFTYFLSLARARARGKTCTLGDHTPGAARSLSGLFGGPRPDAPPGGGLQRRKAFGSGAIAQGALKALSGRLSADATGDVGYATPGVGPAGWRGTGTIRRFGGFLRFLGGRGSRGGKPGYFTLVLCDRGLLYTVFL